MSVVKLKIKSVDISYGIISKLERGSIILYKEDILAGKLTLHRLKYTIIYNVFTKLHINEIEPANNMFVNSVTIKDFSTTSLVTFIIFLIFLAITGSSNYRGIDCTIVYLRGKNYLFLSFIDFLKSLYFLF